MERKHFHTVKQLKKLIENLPDDQFIQCQIMAKDGSYCWAEMHFVTNIQPVATVISRIEVVSADIPVIPSVADAQKAIEQLAYEKLREKYGHTW